MYAAQQGPACVDSVSRFQHAINVTVIRDHWVNTEKKRKGRRECEPGDEGTRELARLSG